MQADAGVMPGSVTVNHKTITEFRGDYKTLTTPLPLSNFQIEKETDKGRHQNNKLRAMNFDARHARKKINTGERWKKKL